MISYKTLVLTLMLTVGFSFQSCDFLGCSCEKLQSKYFNIGGISATNFRKRGTCCADKMGAGEAVALADHHLSVRYQVSYFSAKPSRPARSAFSLINQAVACDCLDDGYLGSKERLKSLTVVTLNDFDAQHLANDTINDLLRITTLPDKSEDLTTYLRGDTALIGQQDYVLYLQKRPALRTDFAAKITVALQNGESYTTTTLPVTIQQSATYPTPNRA